MKELRQRKRLRLKGYDYSLAGCYFITICVKDKHEVLGKIVGSDAHIASQSGTESDAHNVLSKYGAIVKEHIEKINKAYRGIYVDEYVIMPNHVHLILVIEKGTMWASSPTEMSIPKIVRSFKILVSKACGFSYWQRSYHDHIIRNEAEYQKIRQYIKTNPQNWKGDMYFNEPLSGIKE